MTTDTVLLGAVGVTTLTTPVRMDSLVVPVLVKNSDVPSYSNAPASAVVITVPEVILIGAVPAVAVLALTVR